MLSSLGFPIVGFLGWILLLLEIIFGALVLLGWKIRYAVWSLVVVLAVAALTVFVPKISVDPMAMISVFLHIIAITALISLSLTGPGIWAVGRR